VLGERSRDGQTFFVRKVVSFLPEHRQRRFRAPLRKFEFYSDRALYRDPRRRLEVLVDQSAMPIVWDQTWNQWKHFLGTKVEIQATFVEAGKYRHRRGEWQLVKWETAIPSRLAVKLPANTAEQVETARKSYYRFGQFSSALDRIRERIEREPWRGETYRGFAGTWACPVISILPRSPGGPTTTIFSTASSAGERGSSICSGTNTSLLSRPALSSRLQNSATRLISFPNPASREAFLAVYTRTTKEDIRQNRGNVAEMLGFLGRVVHGSSAARAAMQNR